MNAQWSKLLIIGFFVAFIAACSGTGTKTIPIETTDYYLGMGDRLDITVYNQDKLSGEFVVNANGNIAFPLLEAVPATGLTLTELENNIKSKLQPKYVNDPKVSIQIVNRRDIYILGEVETPGRYEYVPNMTLLQAIATAQGYTSRAAEGSAEIKRTENEMMTVFRGVENQILKPGDVIVVKRRWF